MKFARLFLAVLSVSILAACGDTVTGPQAAPPATPSEDTSCTPERLEDGTYICRTGQTGSGG
jgi:predicted small lipoprotein YifL